jgi:hypothetical protein
MQVSFEGSVEMLRAGLQARGYSVNANGTTLRISRRTAGGGAAGRAMSQIGLPFDWQERGGEAPFIAGGSEPAGARAYRAVARMADPYFGAVRPGTRRQDRAGAAFRGDFGRHGDR